MSPNLKEAISRYGDMAYSSARATIDDDYEIKLANLRETLAVQGLIHSSVADRETARLYSEYVKEVVQARGDALIEAYELHGALDEEAEQAIIEDVSLLHEKLTGRLSDLASDEAARWIRRTGHSDPEYVVRAREFSRQVDRLSTPILNVIACQATKRRLLSKASVETASVTNIELHGDNPRVNIQSVDQSLNVVGPGKHDNAPISPLLAQRREMVAKWLGGMTPDEKEALRLLLVCGPLTDRQAISQLRTRGLAKDNPLAIFARIHNETGLLKRLSPPDKASRLLGYEGPYEIQEAFKGDLEDLLGPSGQ
jgi:hypothetical protein